MKTVIEMAREAGLRVGPAGMGQTVWGSDEELERFAELVRADERNSWPVEMEAMERQVNILTDALAKSKADEREACAKVCDDLPPPDGYNMTEISFWDVTSLECAAAIRARGDV